MGAPAELEHRAAAKLARFLILVMAYIGLNSSLNLLNKWSLGVYGFRFPLLLTSCHMAFGFLALSPVAMRQPWETHRRTLRKQWRGVLCIGTFMSLSIVLNNMSLVDVSLTLNQIIRSSIPVVTCALAVLVQRKFPTRQEFTALVVLTSGVMLAVWQGALSGKPYAICFCIASTVSSGAMMTFSSKLLSEKLDVFRLTFYTAPVSLTFLLPLTFTFEREAFLRYLPEHYDGAALIILLSSCNALCYNLVHSTMIKATSAVTTTVLGEVKIVGLLVLSALLLGEGREFTLKMTAGCAMALAGFAMYSHTKIQRYREQLPPTLVPYKSGSGSLPVLHEQQPYSVHADSSSPADGPAPAASGRSSVGSGSGTSLARPLQKLAVADVGRQRPLLVPVIKVGTD